jgi:cephalosporin hydroxylase
LGRICEGRRIPNSNRLLPLVPETEFSSTYIRFRAELAEHAPEGWIIPRLLRKSLRAATRSANERLMPLLMQSLRDLAVRVAPATGARMRRCRRVKNARRLAMRLERAPTLDEKVDLTLNSTFFAANQKRAEILALLQLLQELKPTRLCEIGAAAGGTLALFCQVAASDARILSVDIGYRSEQIAAISHLARRRQQVTCLAADSHALQTLDEVKDWLAGAKLDFLFIDGDHSFDGVSTDYAMYKPLVRTDDGVIALHDIVPDFKTRYGVVTGAYVGDVPTFWAHLKEEARTSELIEDPDQDGMGIGVVRLSGSVDPREE